MLDYKKIKSEFTKKLAEFNETKLLSWVKFDKTKQEYKYIGECTGNNGNGCFLNSPGHNCGCFTRVPKEEAKPHSFCETPEEKCTMNYCDENGCQNRKRELVEPKQENNFYEKLKQYFEETPREKVLEDWAKSAEFDKVGPTVDDFLNNTKNLQSLESKLDEVLSKETEESLTTWLDEKRSKQETLEEVSKVERSDLYNKIHSIVKQIPREDVETDAMDASSCAYDIEQLFYKWQQETKIIECYFIPNNNTSSATICGNCGKEKFLHTIGSGIKVSKSVIITQEEPKLDLEKEMFELEQELDIPSHLRWHNSKPKQEILQKLSPMNDLLQDLKNAKISSKDNVDIINDEFIRGTINKYVQTTLDSVIKRIETELLDGESKWCQEQTLKEKLVIELNEYDYTGSSNDIYGMVVKVNGVEMPYHNLDTSTILEEVLEHLGYEVEIIETLDR